MTISIAQTAGHRMVMRYNPPAPHAAERDVDSARSLLLDLLEAVLARP